MLTLSSTELHDNEADSSVSGCQLQAFVAFCEQNTGLNFSDYRAFEAFAIEKFGAFWSLFLDWSETICEGNREPACTSDDCETAQFFPELRLNYTENLLHSAGNLIGCHVDGNHEVVTPDALRRKVCQLARYLQQLGVQPGDIVAAIARNNVEVIIAALASAAIGAIFSSCAHDMGTLTVLSRFQKLQPKVLVANFASRPWDLGKPLPERLSEIVAALPSLAHLITLDEVQPCTVPMHTFQEAITGDDTWDWQRYPFNHPLFILFSSGTTGTPKCIMHGAGGTLLEHVKEHRLHGDLSNRDRMFFQTSCGWMMWNWQLSALACGAEIVTYDGPLRGPQTLWEIVADQRVTTFGTNPAYLQFCETAGYAPKVLDLIALRSVLSTGSILYPRQFDWIAEQVKDIPVQSISGGTDILGCFVLGNPILPVTRGQAQCRSLGLDVRSLPAGEIGELICANPFPSRPIGFYGEPTNERYHAAYFAQNPGVWTHGDLIEITPNGIIMHGRSDGVMNIRGVRIGPAEIYRILQQIPTIVEAMAVEQTDEREPGGARLILLVVLRGGVALDDALISRIRSLLVEQGNTMMVPTAILQMNELPVTHSGKRSEAAARDAVNGLPIRNRGALLNPDCLDGLVVPRAAKTESGALTGDYESQLCEICQRHLNVAVHPSDNYLALGGDSLVILGFLLEVATRTKQPLQNLIEVSTISELAQLLSGASVSRSHDGPRVRVAEQADADRVSQLLNKGFGRTLPWHRMFDHQWQHDVMPRGFVLTANDKIVGFIGLICVARHIAGKSGLVCNLSSWYVQPDYRGWSNALLAAATQFEGVTYTSLTPGPIARRILRAMGFSPLDKESHYLPPFLQVATLRGNAPLIFDRDEMRPMLNESRRRILDDHSQCDCLPMLLIDGAETAFAIFRRRVLRRRFIAVPYSEMLYCTADNLMDRYLERVKLGVMRRQRTVLMTVGKQYIPTTYGISITGRNLYRSDTFAAHELDKLYSELALLPI